MAPARVISGRAPASSPASLAQQNRALLEELRPGVKRKFAVLQNSFEDWNDQVVEIIEELEDGSLRVQNENGERMFVRFENLARNLSPEVTCGESHDVEICVGQKVIYPAHSASLEIPQATVQKIFANGSVVVRDGLDFVFDLQQLGKEVECSPQKPSICREDHVVADGYRGGEKFSFEGPIMAAFTNGLVVVNSGVLRFPIDVSATRERVNAAEGAITHPGIITSRGDANKLKLPNVGVTTEIEPYNPQAADKAQGAR